MEIVLAERFEGGQLGIVPVLVLSSRGSVRQNRIAIRGRELTELRRG